MAKIYNPTNSKTPSYGNLTEDEVNLRSRVMSRLDKLSSYHSKTYDYIEDQLEYASGEQWDESVRNERENNGMPVMTIPMIQTYINRIVNPLRKNPLGMRVETPDEDLTELISGVIREIESKSRSREAYEKAFYNAVASGLGWIKVGTRFKDDYSMEQEIYIDIVPHPGSIFIDPHSKQTDGSDAKFGVYMTYIDTQEAKELYGDDVGGSIGGINIFDRWERDIPDESTPEMLYYELVEKKVKRFFYQDGSTSDVEIEGKIAVASRDISRKSCKVIKFVGQKIVSEVELPIPFIPLIPVYGDHLNLYKNSDIHLAGVVHWGKASQDMINMYASNEVQLVANSPKAPWIMVEGQDENHPEWDDANEKNYSKLTYTPVALDDGTPAPAPYRADNSAQTQGFIASRNQASQDMGRTLGMFDNMLGGMQTSNESGMAVGLRNTEGELSTIQYIQNLEHSIEQCTRVVLHLVPYVYDTTREITVRSEDGNKAVVPVNLSQVITDELLQNIDIVFSSGPALASKKQEAVMNVMNVMSLMPDKAPMIGDILIDNLDAPGSREISNRLKKMLPPELQEGNKEVDPQVQQLLAQADQQSQAQSQQIQYLEGIVRQLQAEAIADSEKNKTQTINTVIKAEADIAKERIKQSGEDERLQEKIEADASKDMMNVAKDIIGNVTEVTDPIELAPGSEDYVPVVRGPVVSPSVKDPSLVESIEFDDEDEIIFE